MSALAIAALGMTPGHADLAHDDGIGFRAHMTADNGWEVELHFWAESTQYYGGVPLRNVGGKGGLSLYIEIRQFGRVVESGGADETDDGFTWVQDELESVTLSGSADSTLRDWEETPSRIAFEIELTGEGVAEPTLFPDRFVNLHRLDAGLGVQMQRPAAGSVQFTSDALGWFSSVLADGELTTFDRYGVSETVINEDPE